MSLETLPLLKEQIRSMPKGSPWRVSSVGNVYYSDSFLFVMLEYDTRFDEFKVAKFDFPENPSYKGDGDIEIRSPEQVAMDLTSMLHDIDENPQPVRRPAPKPGERRPPKKRKNKRSTKAAAVLKAQRDARREHLKGVKDRMRGKAGES